MKFVTPFATLLLSTALAAQMPGAGAAVDALDGLDPVLLVEGKEVPGKSAFSAVHGGFTYLFSTAENKATFARTPDKYSIQLGGLCARMGKSVSGNPSDFLVHDGRIYIFGSDTCHKRFQESPTKYLPPASRPLSKNADAAARGGKLMNEAARAVGSSLDAVLTYVESFSQTQSRPQGDVQVVTKTTWRFPDRVRQERRMTMVGKPMTSSTLFIPEGAWYIAAQGQAYPMLPAARPSLQLDFGRHPVALLKGRHLAGRSSIAEGPAAIDGVKVERVRLVDAAIDITIDLDASRRIHSVSFVDRNNEGVYGTFTVFYSDYRKADGLTLPFAVRTLFDGQPDPVQSWKVESIAVNAPVDQSLFTPPSKPAGSQ